MPSRSTTCAATIVTVHVSPNAKSVVGSSVHDVGPPVTMAACVLLVPHVMSYHAPFALTGSLKFTTTFAAIATPVAPLIGVVDATVGGKSPAGPNCTSSIASPSSTPPSFVSFQRIQTWLPAASARPVSVPDFAVRFAAALPSSAVEAVPAVVGDEKSSASKLVQFTAVGASVTAQALVQYWKSSLSAPLRSPSRHCSPT